MIANMWDARDRLHEVERQITELTYIEGEVHKQLRLLLMRRARLVRLLQAKNGRRRRS